MVVVFTVFVAALEDWIGWLPDQRNSVFGGFDLSVIVLELVTLIFALWALGRFHFPLLVLAASGAGWFLFTDFISGGGDWSAIVSIAFGVFLLLVALAANPVYGFWLHVVSGLTIGGGLLWFWHTSDTDWILLALAGLLYIWFGGSIERSSWVVLGVFGLLLTTTHFVEKWFGFLDFFPFALLGQSTKHEHEWARPVSYAVLGFVFVMLGLALEMRRRHEPAVAAPLL
jgi:hypothetical protein